MKPGAITWTVYYGASEDGYPTSQSLNSAEEAQQFYETHNDHYARLVECRTIRACEGGNPYANIPAKEIT